MTIYFWISFQFVFHFFIFFFRGFVYLPQINQILFVRRPTENQLILPPCRMEAFLQGLVASLSSLHSHQSCWVHLEVKEDKGKKSLGKTVKHISSWCQISPRLQNIKLIKY